MFSRLAKPACAESSAGEDELFVLRWTLSCDDGLATGVTRLLYDTYSRQACNP